MNSPLISPAAQTPGTGKPSTPRDMRLVTLQMQPRPLTVTVAKATERGVTMTAIDRSWRPEDADRCQLCSVCTVDVDNHCLKLVPWDVPLAEAALFRKG